MATTSKWYDDIYKKDLKVEYNALQDAVYATDNVADVLQHLKDKCSYSGYAMCERDQIAFCVVDALQRHDFDLLANSMWGRGDSWYMLIPGVSEVRYNLNKFLSQSEAKNKA